MQLKTILNHVQKFKSFVYGTVRWVERAGDAALEVEIVERANGRALFGLWVPDTGLRPAPGSPLRVRAVVGHQGVSGLRATSGILPDLRGSGRTSAMGARQAPADRRLCLVPGAMGPAAVVEGGGHGLSGFLG